MKEITGNYYYCKRLRQVDFLHKKGIDYINTIPDFNTKNRVVFVYENTPELNEGLSEYYFLREERLEREKQKELEELARLKAKYE